MKVALLFAVLISCSAYSGLESHFKPAPNKSDSHRMKNVDFIYMINLDQRPEKFARSFQLLSLYGIEPYRFSAVNGWELSLETINQVGVVFHPWMSRERWGTYYLPGGDFQPQHEPIQTFGRTYFCHCMSRGAIGIVLSHLSILKDAYDSGYETIWVLEDDIDVVQNPNRLSDLIERLDQAAGKEGWDILFTDLDTKNNSGQYVPSFGCAWRPNFFPADPNRFSVRTAIDADFKRVGSRFGAYSMIVRRSGMKKLLDFFHEYQIFLPYDIEYVFPPEIRLFTVAADIVVPHIGAPSDNGAPTYKDKTL